MPFRALSKDGVCFLYSGTVTKYLAKIEVVYKSTLLSRLGCGRPNREYSVEVCITTDDNEICETICARSYTDALYIMQNFQFRKRSVLQDEETEEDDSASEETDELEPTSDNIVSDNIENTETEVLPKEESMNTINTEQESIVASETVIESAKEKADEAAETSSSETTSTEDQKESESSDISPVSTE